MIELPQAFLQRMQAMLGKDYPCFLNSLQEETPVSIRYNRRKPTDILSGATVPWCEQAIYLPQRPIFTLDPLLHGGVYYVQEAASMFIEQVIKHLQISTLIRALDLCAAPGGKSTHLLDCLPEGSLLVSNEAIRSRVNILAENLSKWGRSEVALTHNDPKDFAALPSFFDLLLVDAPCSGEGMFRKDPAAVKEWSEASIKRCAERQRRILVDAWDTLKEGGHLIYSTCTYNREENEENVQWIIERLGAELLRIPLQADWKVNETDRGYRFFPHKTRGEGFFISLLQKKSAAPQNKKHRASAINSLKQFPRWFKGEFTIVRHNEFVQAWPTALVNDICLLRQQLRVVQVGIPIGEIKGKDIVPHTAVALSTALRSDAFPREELNIEDVLRFLRRDNISLQNRGATRLLNEVEACPVSTLGYHIITYKEHPLGFVKNLGVRCNNLYPNNWRIRMAVGAKDQNA